jgi:hypothetical protein
MVRAISDDPQLLIFGSVSLLLPGRVGHSERAMVAKRLELAFQHREPIVSESNPTIRRPEINS